MFEEENELINLENNRYLLFGDTIEVTSDSISEDDYNKMLDYLKGDIFDLYIKIWETKNSINIINNNNNNNNNMKEINTIINLLNSKKQIILQGAPGTGKTFITAEIAIALCDGIDNIPPTREEIMIRYNKLVEEERIAFTTFHQSMDYEEFIEGIKPIVENTSNTMIYKPQAGIFKKMYEKILEDMSEEPKQYVNDTFEFLFDKLIEKIGNGEINTITQKKGKNKVITVSDQEIIKVDNYSVVKSNLKEIYKSCKQNCKVRDIRNSPKNIGKVSSPSAYWGVLQKLYKIKESELRKKEALKPQIGHNDLVPYVLIIDEINRGNISKIFGELITLLENDKRMGEKNELWATLPYSNKKFSVPSNVYIIGTMNTADRSLGYIDYAVRRRFAFYTLKADKSVIENYYQNNEALKSEAINLFDEVQKLILKNIASEFNVEDLMIGHSYFLAKDEEELNMKLEYEIKPLLREYAFDGILDKLKKEKEGGEYKGKYKEIENLGKVSNIIDNYQEDSENGED
jgi:5-methylcytosine-specific restriction protein B